MRALVAAVRETPSIRVLQGATLIDETGTRFMAGVPGGELAAREVVARAVSRHLAGGHHVYLARTQQNSRVTSRQTAFRHDLG
jgi:aspartate oxidase